MQLTALALAAGGTVAASDPGPVDVEGVSFDSRSVRAGDLFLCVPGARYDGHDHAAAAVAAGAVALAVERRLDLDVAQIVVPSVRAAMGPLAGELYGHPSRSLRLVGITGTNGKTTTTFMTESILSAAGYVTGLTGTVETRIAGEAEAVEHTTPEAPDVQRLLRRMVDAGVEAAAIEVSSHALDQGRVDGTWFSCVAFTNLTQDHLDYHGTMSAYYRAKASLFDPGRTAAAAVNVDDDHGREIAERVSGGPVDLVTVAAAGRDRAADVTVSDIRPRPTGTDFALATPAGERDVALRLGGVFQAANAAVAAGVAVALGLDLDATVAGLESLAAVPGRFEAVDAGQDFGIVVDYAHTPDGVENVLRAARAVAAGGRVLCVFGCGGDRDRAKRPLMGRAAATLADHVVVTSDNPRTEDPYAIIAEILPGVRQGTATFDVEADRRAAIRLALGQACPGDVVVVAGKGHETGQEVDGVLHPFDDRAVAREEVEARL